jgi:hypothetical protein
MALLSVGIALLALVAVIADRLATTTQPVEVPDENQ